MGENSKETSLWSFRKIRNCIIFERQTIQPKMWKLVGGILNGTEIRLVKACNVAHFSENSGKYCSCAIRQWKVLKVSNRNF